MSASMLDEVVVPQDPKLFVCPCCKFSFRQATIYLTHLEAMKTLVQKAIDAARVK